MEDQNVVQEPVKEMSIRQVVSESHGEALVKILENAHPLDAGILIRENVSPDQIKELKADKDMYARFKAVRDRAIEMYNYNNKPAKMGDVDRAATNVYTILLRMIKVMNEEIESFKGTIDDLRMRQGLDPIYAVEEAKVAESTDKPQGADISKNDTTTDL